MTQNVVASFDQEGVARTRLGYEVLVKLKVDEFLEQEYRPTDRHHDDGPAEIAAP